MNIIKKKEVMAVNKMDSRNFLKSLFTVLY